MWTVKRITNKLILIMTLFSVIGNASAKTTNDEKPTLKVGFMSSIKRVQDGQYVGALPDVMRETAAHAKYNLVLQAMPIKRLLKSLETGQVDAVIGLFKREERSVYATYLDAPIGWVCANMFVLNSTTDITADPLSLRYKNIGMLRGANWGSELQKTFEQQKVFQTHVSNYEMLAKMLDKGRFDAVVASRDAFKSAAKKQDIPLDYIGLPLPYATSVGMYIIVSKNSKLNKKGGLTKQLNDALNELTSTQIISTVYQRHGKTFDQHCKQ